MEIHPIVKEFIEAPMSHATKTDGNEIDVERWKENFEKINEMFSGMTLEEKERASKFSHEYLFGKS